MRFAMVFGVMVGVGLLAGCRVERSSHEDGERISVETPVGGLRVRTDGAAAAMGVGLPVYPGAKLVDHGKDGGAADIDLNLGETRLRVKAAHYQTSDGEAEVEQFYRKAMRGYGDVVACRDGKTVGEPTVTADGLDCDGKGSHVDDGGGEMELLTGSRKHQHVVTLGTENGETQIGMVVLDLPKGSD